MSKPKTGVEKVQEAAEIANTLSENGEITVTLKDDTVVEIYKCRAKNVGTVLDFVQFAMKELGIDDIVKTVDINLSDPTVILQLIAKTSNKLFSVASELCSLEYKDFIEMELDDAIDVVLGVIEVNKSFFLQSVLPKVQSVLPAPEEATE